MSTTEPVGRSKGRRAGLVLAGVLFLALLAIVIERSTRDGAGTSAIPASASPLVAAESLAEPEELAARVPNASSEAAPVVENTQAERADEPPAAADELGCTLHGRVLDEDGNPIPTWKPYISLTDAAGSRRNTEASDEGQYSMTGLAPGRWTLHVGAIGYRTWEQPIELVASEPIVRRDLVLERAVVLAVRLKTPEGEPLYATAEGKALGIARPFPVATVEPPGVTIPEAMHGGNDLCRAGSLWDYGPLWEAAGPGCAGVLVLEVELPVFVSLTVGSRVLQTQRVEPGAREVAFVVSPEGLRAAVASIEARVLGASGEPLACRVEVEPLNDFYQVGDGHWLQELPPGTHRITISAPGHARHDMEVTLGPGEQRDLGDVLLPVELTIEGRLLDDSGAPVSGMVRLARVDETGRARYDDRHYVPTDASGAFRIDGLAPDRYLVRTIGDDEVRFPGRDDPPTVWVSGLVPVSTVGGSVSGLDLHLVRAASLVLAGTDALPAGARFRVLDANEDVVRYVGFYTGFVPRFALPPAAYTLIVLDKEGNELARHAVDVSEGVTELDLSR